MVVVVVVVGSIYQECARTRTRARVYTTQAMAVKSNHIKGQKKNPRTPAYASYGSQKAGNRTVSDTL